MKNLDKIIIEALTEVYSKATPPLNFELFLIEPPEDDNWFENYTISEPIFMEILEKYIKLYKLKPWEIEKFKFNMFLGPSPKFC